MICWDSGKESQAGLWWGFSVTEQWVEGDIKCISSSSLTWQPPNKRCLLLAFVGVLRASSHAFTYSALTMGPKRIFQKSFIFPWSAFLQVLTDDAQHMLAGKSRFWMLCSSGAGEPSGLLCFCGKPASSRVTHLRWLRHLLTSPDPSSKWSLLQFESYGLLL